MLRLHRHFRVVRVVLRPPPPPGRANGNVCRSLSPMYYAIVGLPSLIVTSTTGMYLMRTVSSLLGALFLALAIMSVFCWSSRRLLQIGVLLAATPTAAYYASSVNPNGLEIMAAICLWCSGIILVSERSEESTTRPDRSGCGLSDRSDADEKPVPLMGSGDPCVVGGARLPPLAVSAVEKARRPTMDAPLHPLWGVRRRMGSCRARIRPAARRNRRRPGRPTTPSYLRPHHWTLVPALGGVDRSGRMGPGSRLRS